jgi:carbon-monoxide dehydrogenase medium subunit
VIRTNLRYHAPATVDEACRILAGSEAGAVIGGGTMLVPRMTRGERSVLDAVHLRNLGLETIEQRDDTVEIGAGVTYTQILEAPAGAVPQVLTTMARGITGGAQIRNQGTLAGSAAYANPSSDVPAVLVALDAAFEVHGVHGHRTVPATEFFRGAFQTALQPDEILTRISMRRDGVRAGYAKLKLSESSWPIVTAAAVASPRPDGAWDHRLVIGGASATPVVVPAEVLANAGSDLDAEGAGRVRQAVQDAVVEPWSDELAPGSYRRQVSGAIALRAIAQLQKELTA